MPIKYPDFLQHNNPNEVLIDATENQTKGFGFFDTTSDRDSLSSNLRTDGYLAMVGTTSIKPYIFQGGTWTDSANWVEIGGGGLDHVVEDLTPQLGGDLDVNGQSIVSTSDGNITFTPNGTGRINLDGTVEFKRFSSAPDAFIGGMYADDQNNLYFGIDETL